MIWNILLNKKYKIKETNQTHSKKRWQILFDQDRQNEIYYENKILI